LWGGVAFANLEKFDPEKSDSDGSNTSNGAAEEVENQEGHDDIIDWEDLGGLYEDPIDRLENIDAG
jgi:hypothetical protein